MFNIQNTPYSHVRRLSILGTFLILGIVLTLASDIIKTLGLPNALYLVFLIAYFVVMYYLARLEYVFRKRQIIWLKEHGIKLVCTFKRVKFCFFAGYPKFDVAYFIETEASDLTGRKTIYKSDIVYSGLPTGNPYKRLNEACLRRAGTIDVYVNKSNPLVYWIDTSWLHLGRLGIKKVAISWLMALLGFLLFVCIVFILNSVIRK